MRVEKKNNEERVLEEVEAEEAVNEQELQYDEGAEAASVEELEKENILLKQQILRLKADFENFRRRTRVQMESIVNDANEKLLIDILPVLDNFERALGSQGQENGEEQDPFQQGMCMVFEGLLAALSQHGLEVIRAEGEAFDPQFHDAISMQGDSGGSLKVIKAIQTGYLLNGKVLRHAKVLVGQNEEEE